MSFKFDPNAASERKYITKAGTFDVVVKSWSEAWLAPRADYYIRFVLENAEGETVNADIFSKPEKNGEHSRLNQFVAASATKDEISNLVKRGDFDVTDDFLREIATRATGRAIRVVVTEKKFLKRDGTEGVAFQGSFFRRLPAGPDSIPF
jgi:hypothetical protein